MLKRIARRGAYVAADVVTLGRGIPRRVNGETIRFAPSVARYYPASYEPDTHEFIRRHTAPGSVAIDAGAHIGLFTVLMGRAVGAHGRVLSFEPTATTARLLRRTVTLNGLGAVVDCREEAVAGRRGFAEFFVDAHHTSNANSFVRRPGAIGSVRVPTVTIDDLAAEAGRPVSCVKIDVEGAELDVLRGSARTLAADRPALTLDIHPAQLQSCGGSVAEIWDLLVHAGYVPVDGAGALNREAIVAREQIFELHAVADA